MIRNAAVRVLASVSVAAVIMLCVWFGQTDGNPDAPLATRGNCFSFSFWCMFCLYMATPEGERKQYKWRRNLVVTSVIGLVVGIATIVALQNITGDLALWLLGPIVFGLVYIRCLHLMFKAKLAQE